MCDLQNTLSMHKTIVIDFGCRTYLFRSKGISHDFYPGSVAKHLLVNINRIGIANNFPIHFFFP